MSNRKPVLLVLLLGVSVAVIVLSGVLGGSDTWRMASPLGDNAGRTRIEMLEQMRDAGPFGWHPAGMEKGIGALATFAFLWLFGVIVLFLIPDRIQVVKSWLRPGWGHLARLLVIGLLAEMSAAVAALLGFYSVVAAPFSILLAICLLLLASMGWVSVVVAFGRWFLRRMGYSGLPPLAVYSIGLVILFAAGRLPILGWIALFMVNGVGVGAVLASRLGSGVPWSLDALKQD